MPLSGVEYTEFAPSTIFKTVECAGYALSISTGSFAVFDPTTNTSRAFSWPAFYPYYVGAWSHAGKTWAQFAYYGYSPTYLVMVDPSSGLAVTKSTPGTGLTAGVGDYLFGLSNRVYQISTDTATIVAGADRGVPASANGRLFGSSGTTLTELSPDASLTTGSSWTMPIAQRPMAGLLARGSIGVPGSPQFPSSVSTQRRTPLLLSRRHQPGSRNTTPKTSNGLHTATGTCTGEQTSTAATLRT